ncbi:chalcone-flavanone isomerase-domain-containing protein [Suillus subaureus]|uniref:Chalcone-flavanone isomerase-domain-containing protein n=1 Tax=Suillus subaureus TaxID=48587 RepID=A0A9P7JJQ0_9AGAM|nr:chalcone-flavanone isomerase-domain-containing protein [Suillus subaureus]KAG1826242.1 chalcone-flavanone isomerase-domain-containing protein [Suillus subaureus]
MSQFLRPLAIFSSSWSRSCITRTSKQSRSFVKPLLWGTAISIFSAAYAVQSTTIHLDAGSSLPDSEFEIDPATSIAFPKTLCIPSKIPLPQFSLVGVGVRTVSFLGIKVYSVGFYADLANPNLNIPMTATPDQKIEHIILPTRGTSYSHLRDGFMRALTARMQLAHTRATITPEEEPAAQSSLRTLKSLFPTTSMSKGKPFDIVLLAPLRSPSRPRTLVLTDMGSVENDWVAEEFVLAYFEGNGISPPLKKAVIEHVQTFGSSI